MPVLKIYKNGMWEDVSASSSVEVDSSLSTPGMAADAKITGDAINSKEQKIYKQNDEPVDAPDGTIWIDLDAEGSGGGSAVIELDTSLTVSGMAADSKTVGDALSELNTLVGNTVALDGSKAMTGTLQMGGNKITGVAYPTSATDVATKEFVETFSAEGNTYVATDDNDDGNVVIRPYAADVDDVTFLGHIVDKNNPHGVTAAQTGARPDTWLPTIAEIGAAPSGYGLGDIAGSLPDIDDCHNAMVSGWYNVSFDTANGIDAGGVLRVDAYGWNSRVLTIYSTGYTGYGLVVLQKTLFNGTWTEWEWVNPMMVPGEEYRTTERYNGKPVYALAINANVVSANSAFSVNLSSYGIGQIIYDHCGDGNNGILYGDDIADFGIAGSISYKATTSAIYGKNTSSYNVRPNFVLKYTKA